MKKRSESSRKYMIKKYLNSGMNHREFCRQEGIGESSLYHWLKKYDVKSGSNSLEESNFIPIEVFGSENGSGMGSSTRIESSFKVKTIGGYELDFMSGCKLSDLKLLLELCDAPTQ